MIINKARLISLLLLMCAFHVNAGDVYVEPDNFPLGIDIRNAYPEVTLSVTQAWAGSNQTTKPVLVLDGFNTLHNRNLATTGTRVFGQPIDRNLPLQTGQHWDEVTYGLLRADFSRPARFVQIDLIFDDDDTGFLWAFDSNGNLLESVQAKGDARGSSSPFCPPTCDEFARVAITRNRADISYILAGGIGIEGLFLDNLIFTSTTFVNIDIVSQTEKNEVNPNVNSLIKVAILTEGEFDALQVDTFTIRFGSNEANAISNNTEVADVDRDGDVDLIVMFRTNQTGIICEDTQATLVGETFAGASFIGADAIKTTSCK